MKKTYQIDMPFFNWLCLTKMLIFEQSKPS
jgi:hypothetical protein